MTRVLLYCRVSTDEQADGCSLDVQERFLRAYCANHGYEIIGEAYRDDYTGKGYQLKRPELKKLYEYCVRHTKMVDKVLFLRWDRFTRNLEFGMTYKRKFNDEMGIEINSIENTINFNAPEWPTLLALYIGVAQTENEKNSKRTKEGIHGTQLKGKCSGLAPKGYENVRISKHDCWVDIVPEEADKIRLLFKEVAKGVEVPTYIRDRVYPQLKDTTFFHILRDRFYAGYVHVKAYGDDPEQYVKGQHEAIIDEDTFNKVQFLLDKKKGKQTAKVSRTIIPDLYLRKVLICPVCGHILTGAYSKGNGGKYAYYFCNHDHKHLNVRAEKVNDGFRKFISVLKPHKAIVALYKEILNDVCGDHAREVQSRIVKLQAEADGIKARINKVKDMYYDGEITKAEKEDAVNRYTRQVESLNSQIQSLRLGADSQMKGKLEYAINIIENLATVFQKASPEVKLKLIGSIFPEKIEFDGTNYRTTSYNQVLDNIFQNIKQLGENKNENDANCHSHFHQGWMMGLEPTTLGTTIRCSTS